MQQSKNGTITFGYSKTENKWCYNIVGSPDWFEITGVEEALNTKHQYSVKMGRYYYRVLDIACDESFRIFTTTSGRMDIFVNEVRNHRVSQGSLRINPR